MSALQADWEPPHEEAISAATVFAGLIDISPESDDPQAEMVVMLRTATLATADIRRRSRLPHAEKVLCSLMRESSRKALHRLGQETAAVAHARDGLKPWRR